jgi:TetR/AcrR family transcriptional repressor of nem operon
LVTQERQTRGDTATRVLDVAEELVQRRGFNGFSYADIASELNITTASLHYHFAGKAQLGRALINRYSSRFFDALAGIDERLPGAPSKLRAYANLYAAVLQKGRLCLCGMLAAEYNTLPEPMRAAILDFFRENEAWLARVLTEGEQAGTLHLSGPAQDAARMITGAMEGAMLVARPFGDVARFQSAAEGVIASLEISSR